MAYSGEKSDVSRDSDNSDNLPEVVRVSKKKTSKSIFVDCIARNLVNSHDIVDKRMLKLHKIVSNSSKSRNLLDYLGVSAEVSRRFTRT